PPYAERNWQCPRIEFGRTLAAADLVVLSSPIRRQFLRSSRHLADIVPTKYHLIIFHFDDRRLLEHVNHGLKKGQIPAVSPQSAKHDNFATERFHRHLGTGTNQADK